MGFPEPTLQGLHVHRKGGEEEPVKGALREDGGVAGRVRLKEP